MSAKTKAKATKENAILLPHRVSVLMATEKTNLASHHNTYNTSHHNTSHQVK